MRLRTLPVLLLALSFAAPAAASFGEKPDRPAPPPAAEASPPPLTPRQQAERSYGEAYDEVARATRDLEAGKSKGVEKRWRKVLDRATQAAELDTSYHEAWNLVGFSQRKLGHLPESLAAYRRCLRVAPAYAPAREYYGEALLESGDPAGAQEQAGLLRKQGHEDLAAQLEKAIAAREAPAGSSH